MSHITPRDHQVGILNFVAKLFLMLVQNSVSPTQDNNELKWHREIIVAARVAVRYLFRQDDVGS